jgi:Ca2+/Na+ antiporter
MKELVADFKTIFKKDRGLLIWMIVLFILSVILFVIPIIRLNPTQPKVWARYSDIDNGYSQGDWWYLLSFSVMALTLGLGHIMLGARLFTKRGKDVARLFLGISMIIVMIAIYFVSTLLGEG